MWNNKTEVISVLIRANRIISNTSRNYQNNTPGNHGIKETQKTATLALRT
jgi:hypothetical protein